MYRASCSCLLTSTCLLTCEMAAAARSVNDARPARGCDGKGRSSARELRLMPSAPSPWRSPGAARKSAGCCVRGAGAVVSASTGGVVAALAALVAALVVVLPAAAVCVAAAAAAAAGLVEKTASWSLSGLCGLLTEEAELRRPPGGVGGLWLGVGFGVGVGVGL